MISLCITAVLGGCEVHATGVGTGLLALYLRWLVHLTFRSSTTDQAAIIQHHPRHYSNNSNNLMAVFLLVAVVITIFMIISKKFGFRRNRFTRKICPCL